MLYNSQFALELEGWEHSNDVTTEEYNNSNVAKLAPNSYIKQSVSNIRNHFKANEYTFSCGVIATNNANITIKVGEQQQTISVNGEKNIELKFASADNYDVEISTDAEIRLDNIRLYSQVQSGLLYDENNNELECISGIRELNKQLDTTVTYEKAIENLDISSETKNENVSAQISQDNKENESNDKTCSFTIENSNSLPSDFNMEIVENNNNILLEGDENSWDSDDVLNPSVIQINQEYFNYYSGYDGNVWRTGLAISDDGKTWRKYSDLPVLDLSQDSWDKTYIAANGSAIYFNNEVYYYYHAIDSTTGKSAIGLAISKDGYSFEKYGSKPVLTTSDGAWNSSAVADPYVIEYDGKLYMYYLGENQLGVQKLGVAVSEDGINWKENSLNPIMDIGADGAFDDKGLGEPSVIYQAPYFYMLYTGRNANEQRNIGLAVSTDGVNWKKMNYQGIFTQGSSEWNSKVICDTTMLYNQEEDLIDVWYGGGNVASPDENLNGKIGMFKIKLNKNVENTEIDFTNDNCDMSLIKGCYSIERNDGGAYVWASDNVKTVLKNNVEKDTIVLKGNLDLSLMDYAGKEPFQITVSVNGNVVGKQIVEKNGDFEIVANKDSGISDTFELSITTNKRVVPKEYNLSEDTRKLSYKLLSISQR
jgi:predicted GH43/DUF377 family glycosyl hydrolase